ncbi:site-specific integrase [Pseudomonas gingeri]|uniref:site-specific integrase n=1 Tax=Pseudomonas gingeri TaxID=117681 RepID=UPI0015A22AD4|nr:site-specific integrase [Pseudomonas gingeri]NWD69383.1 site-specific integrase [Pseudomonas gingeri]
MENEDLNLVFPSMAYGTHEWPYDFIVLTRLGGANTPRNLFPQFMQTESNKARMLLRFPFVKLMHECLLSDLARGIRQPTVVTRIRAIFIFYSWVDSKAEDITIDNVDTIFSAWTEELLYRVNIKKDLKHMTAYRYAKHLDRLIARIQNTRVGPLHKTRLSAESQKKGILGTQADKQNLQQSFEYGNLLLELSENLSYEAIIQPLPLFIRLTNGQVLEEWSGYPKPIGPNPEGSQEGEKYRYRYRSKRTEADPSLKTRMPLVNLRVETEILIFISQTGLNLAQACKMKRGAFRYKTVNDEFNVYRVFKGRKQGNVEFKIYKEYRIIFERYLGWLDKVLSEEDERLFPFSPKHQIPSIHFIPSFHAIIFRCKQLGVKYFTPSALRNTRANWILRKSRNPSLTAEMSQHTAKTLIHVYEKPHHQSAAAEISNFHRSIEPVTTPPSPGACATLSLDFQQVSDAHRDSPQADCINAAGCLFCSFHRDVDSFDYAWSLMTYRALKFRELERFRGVRSNVEAHPTKLLIDKITEKLERFSLSSATREDWKHEAESRMREERYHPMFAGIIELMEISFA